MSEEAKLVGMSAVKTTQPFCDTPSCRKKPVIRATFRGGIMPYLYLCQHHANEVASNYSFDNSGAAV